MIEGVQLQLQVGDGSEFCPQSHPVIVKRCEGPHTGRKRRRRRRRRADNELDEMAMRYDAWGFDLDGTGGWRVGMRVSRMGRGWREAQGRSSLVRAGVRVLQLI